MSELGPVEEAEIIVAAAGQFQERNPGVDIARVEVVDLKDIESRGLTCQSCGKPITVCYFIQVCDDCLDARDAAREETK